MRFIEMRESLQTNYGTPETPTPYKVQVYDFIYEGELKDVDKAIKDSQSRTDKEYFGTAMLEGKIIVSYRGDIYA